MKKALPILTKVPILLCMWNGLDPLWSAEKNSRLRTSEPRNRLRGQRAGACDGTRTCDLLITNKIRLFL